MLLTPLGHTYHSALTILQRDKPFYILQNENGWPSTFNVVQNMMYNSPPSLSVPKALPFACCAKWLAWEARHVDINSRDSAAITLPDILVQNAWRKIVFDPPADTRVGITAEVMPVLDS